MRRLTVSLATLSLVVLAGCGGTDNAEGDAEVGGNSAAAPATSGINSAGEDAVSIKAENMVADCMKKKGFRYVPSPMEAGGDRQQVRYAGTSSVLEAPDEVRAFRAKYGFGGFAQLVYPNDPAVKMPVVDPSKNPNNAIRANLDPAQQKAYDAALDGTSASAKGNRTRSATDDSGCAGEAATKYYGSEPSKDDKAASAREYAKFQNDPAVIAAAQKYGSCLKTKGYQVKSAQPGNIEQSMFTTAIDNYTRAGQLDANAAKAKLTQEIKAALDDLECRTDYATLVRTKWAKAAKTGNGVG